MTMTSGDARILQLIKQDHDTVKGLFQQFQQTVQQDKGKAQSLSRQILNDLKLHTELEEQIVYPRLREQDEMLFHEAEEEHHVAELLIGELEKMRVEDPAFAAKMMVLQENVQHHIQEEENEMFPKIGQLPQNTLMNMAEAWQSLKEKAGAAD